MFIESAGEACMKLNPLRPYTNIASAITREAEIQAASSHTLPEMFDGSGLRLRR